MYMLGILNKLFVFLEVQLEDNQILKIKYFSNLRISYNHVETVHNLKSTKFVK